MIPHHEQAVEMSDVILGKADIDPRVTQLAQQIKDAQGPEITTMKGWLQAWGTPYDGSAAGGHGMGMGGMLPEQEMAALKAASGVEASRLFLTGMIGHHDGAIDMAQQEVDGGRNADVVALAKQVIAGQTAEIATMKQIRASL